jgi:hypothetical protein
MPSSIWDLLNHSNGLCPVCCSLGWLGMFNVQWAVTFNVLDDFDLWVNVLQSMVFFREYYLKVKRVQIVFGDCSSGRPVDNSNFCDTLFFWNPSRLHQSCLRIEFCTLKCAKIFWMLVFASCEADVCFVLGAHLFPSSLPLPSGFTLSILSLTPDSMWHLCACNVCFLECVWF